MSRSRRAPIWTEGQKSPGTRAKRRRRANKEVRSAEDVANGGSYKKVSESWAICDYKFYYPKSPKVRRK